MNTTTLITCPSCRLRFSVSCDQGDMRVACPACPHQWHWSPGGAGRRRWLLATLAFVLFAGIGGLWIFQNKMLVEWDVRLSKSHTTLQKGDHEEAKQFIDQLDQDWDGLPAWYWVPMTRGRLNDLQDKANKHRQMVEEVVRQEAMLAGWLTGLQKSERDRETGKPAAAEQVLGPIETELAGARDWQCLPTTQKRLDRLRKMAQGQRKVMAAAVALAEEKARAERKREAEALLQAAAIKSALEGVRAHLKAQAYDLAEEALLEAVMSAPAPDPLFDALAFFVKNYRQQNRPWKEPRDAQALDQVIGQAADWQIARLADTSDKYVAFLTRHRDSCFTELARIRLMDIAAGGRLRDPPGRIHSTLKIHNDSEHELTLTFSGPESFTVIFAAKEKGSVELVVGTYTMGSLEKSEKIRAYDSQTRFFAEEYETRFVVRPDRFFNPDFNRLPPRDFRDLRQPPQPWPIKRTLPDYLK